MADKVLLHIGENSPEGVAFKLFQEVASAENMTLVGVASRGNMPDRKWILETYRECLFAATSAKITD